MEAYLEDNRPTIDEVCESYKECCKECPAYEFCKAEVDATRLKGAKMPHSLRAKIKGLRYKGIITDKDCDRLCKALDNDDVLNKIRAEIEALDDGISNYHDDRPWIFKDEALDIIDKYRNEVNHEDSN